MKTLLASLCLMSGLGLAQPKPTCGFDVEVTQVKPGGVVWVLLFDDTGTFPTKRDKANRRVDVVPNGDTLQVAFEGLTCGAEYAVAVVHDENGNGKLDTGLFRIPREGLGSSRNARGFMGPPSFADAKVTAAPGRTAVPIKLNY